MRNEIMGRELTGWAVEQMLWASLDHPLSTAMYEGLCAGNDQSAVRGVVVCYTPTLDVLRRAAAEHKNLIISREHPFYLHGGLYYAYCTGGLEAAMKDDPVVQAKRDLINANNMMVYRFGTAWDNFRPQARSAALARAMGLTPITPQANVRSRGVICDLPPTALTSLAQTAADRLKAPAPRIVGDLKATVTRVAVFAGSADTKRALADLIADPKIDGIITGAGGVIDEVDGAIGYFQDVIGSGRNIAMLAVGYGPSEDPGMEEMAKWLRTVLADQVIEWWPVRDAGWIPRA
jgi:putative NIF3 family GTP cyclohydrolase 1 type 2